MKHIFYEKYLSNNIYQQMEKQSRMPIQGRYITHLIDFRSFNIPNLQSQLTT